MENPEMKKKAPDMGLDTSRVFAGKTENQTNLEAYGETADFFATEIRKRLPPRTEPYTILDVGAFQGELLKDLLAKLPEYKFQTIAVDINEKALQNNHSTENKVVAHAEALPFGDKSIDVAIVRYVMQWNTADRQHVILSELSRVIRNFAIIEHVGANVVETDVWREKMDDLLDGVEIPKMRRTGYFFSSRDEIETWMTEQNIKFERIKDRIINDGASVFIERYALTEDEAKKAREILGDKNHFEQSDWIVFPK